MTLVEFLSTGTIDKALSFLSKRWGKPEYFKHFNAKTIDEAVFLLSEYIEEANIIAGGVDLISLVKNRVIKPKVLVNIKTIPGLAYITEDIQGLRIGTLTTISDIESSVIIEDRYTALTEAAHSVAAPQIRNMATIGGNLCQDVRCWYYRRSPVTGKTFFCIKKGGEVCYAPDGENTYHAIIGENRCHSVCPSDMASVLLALDAEIRIATPDGENVIALEDFYTSMGNVLKPNEIITEIQVPTPKPGTKQRFFKFRLRKAIDFAISSVATVITAQAVTVTSARIVLGGIAPIPYRAVRAEEVLVGKVINESIAEMSAKAAINEAKPLSMNAYKIPITKALVKRAVLQMR